MQSAPEKNEGLFMLNGDPVSLERYVWIADYSNGSYLKQFDERDWTFHRFQEIQQDKLSVFIMQCVDDEKRRYELHFTEGMKLIHYYRNICLNFGTPQEQKFKLYCFGFEKGGQKVIFSIWPNGEVSIGENHPL